MLVNSEIISITISKIQITKKGIIYSGYGDMHTASGDKYHYYKQFTMNDIGYSVFYKINDIKNT